MARPTKTVDPTKVIELASKGLIQEEIAAFCDVHVNTIRRRFSEQIEKGRNLMHGQLRAKQFEVAMKGNPVMLIWMGKNQLGQADKQEIDVRKQITQQFIVGIPENKIGRMTEGYFRSLPEAIDVANTSNQTDSQSLKSDE